MYHRIWNSTPWLGTNRPQQSSLKKTLQSYKTLAKRLENKLEQLSLKKRELESKAEESESTVRELGLQQTTLSPRPLKQASATVTHLSIQVDIEGGETTPIITHPSSPPSHQAVDNADMQPSLRTKPEETNLYHNDMTSLVATATSILLESVELRLSYVMERIQQLTTLYQENPKQRTPPELMFYRYKEWVHTNQRLFELNSQLFDLEKIKFDVQRKKDLAKQPTKKFYREEVDFAGSQLIHSSALRIQSLLSRYQFPSQASTAQTYLQEVLTQRGDRITLEAQKVQEYVNECVQNSSVDLDKVIGAHPQSYQQFMTVLCNFIVERQRELQGEDLSYNMVYNTVEHIIIPQVQNHLLRYVEKHKRDVRIQEQCEKFKGVTLYQLRVKPKYHSPELEPFINSISQLRATYFSPTPTDKMSAVVAAAKALYDQLNLMGEDSIDGDSFLDLWVYVCIKANIPDLATNIEFMSEYGNPTLGLDEAGYYLVTLNVAANYIEKLTVEDLKKNSGPETFVVCEREKFRLLSEAERSCFYVVSEREELQGYKIAVIKDWVLRKARLYCSVLINTGDPEDIAVVSTIRLSPENSTTSDVEYFTDKLINPQKDLDCLRSQTTPIGDGIVLDLESANKSLYFILEESDFDFSFPLITHVIHLIRLGSESTEMSHDDYRAKDTRDLTGVDSFVYVHSLPLKELEESETHRQLFQSEGSDDEILHSRTRSKSIDIAVSPSSQLTRPTPVSSIFHSPYLISYSPRHRNSLTSFPPEIPTKVNQKNFLSHGRREDSESSEALIKTGSNSKTSTSKQHVLYQRDHSGIPTVVMDEPKLAVDDGDSILLSSSFHPDIPVLNIMEASMQDDSFQQQNMNQPDMKLQTDLVESDTSSTIPLPTNSRRFTKSDNYLYPKQQVDSNLFLSGNRERSSSMKRLRKSLMSHLSFSKVPKDGFALHRKTELTEPLLYSHSQLKKEDEKRLQSEIYSASEESYTRPEERGRGSYVVLKVKDPGPVGFLNEVYVKKLEDNFRLNHMFGSLAVDVDEGMRNRICQGQLYLQHLNYLSLTVKIDDTFSDVMLIAVRRFQEAHNQHDSRFSSSLEENGYLTTVTFQYIRQAFLTVYASMLRLGILSQLGENFDPTSMKQEDVQAFRKCVHKYQKFCGLSCHSGVLCSHTIAALSKDIYSGRQMTSRVID